MLPPLETESGTEKRGNWYVHAWFCFVFSVLHRVLGWQVAETELQNQIKLRKNKEFIGSYGIMLRIEGKGKNEALENTRTREALGSWVATA